MKPWYACEDVHSFTLLSSCPSPQCCNCSGSTARCWCVDCNEALCDDCVLAHRRVTLTRSHRLLNQPQEGPITGHWLFYLWCTSGEHVASLPWMDFNFFPPPPGHSLIFPTKFCRLHPAEALRLFCFTCNQLTCRDCQLVAHKNHRYVRLTFRSKILYSSP